MFHQISSINKMSCDISRGRCLSCRRYLTGLEYEAGGSGDPADKQWTTETDRTVAYWLLAALSQCCELRRPDDYYVFNNTTQSSTIFGPI